MNNTIAVKEVFEILDKYLESDYAVCATETAHDLCAGALAAARDLFGQCRGTIGAHTPGCEGAALEVAANEELLVSYFGYLAHVQNGNHDGKGNDRGKLVLPCQAKQIADSVRELMWQPFERLVERLIVSENVHANHRKHEPECRNH